MKILNFIYVKKRRIPNHTDVAGKPVFVQVVPNKSRFKFIYFWNQNSKVVESRKEDEDSFSFSVVINPISQHD